MKHLPLALLAALALVSCKAQAPDPNPDAKPGLSVENARLVLPAVKGNPGAAYFELKNSGASGAELAAVYVTGSGGAEIHGTAVGEMNRLEKVAVAPGETVSFAPGGKHVMVFDLLDTVVAGSGTELTLSFADGDKLSTNLKVEAPGGNAAHDAGHGDAN